VADPRLDELARIEQSEKTTYGLIEVRDIAGLIKGAAKGAGMGNAFLSHIRGVSAVLHVVRCFADVNVTHVEDQGSLSPVQEYESVLEELLIADLEVASKRLPALRRKAQSPKDTEATRSLPVFEKGLAALEKGEPVRSVLTDDDRDLVPDIPFITAKPTLVVANVDAESAKDGNELSGQLADYCGQRGQRCTVVSAKLEMEACQLREGDSDAFQREYLMSFGLERGEPALMRILRECMDLMDIHYYYTSGQDESRAWFIPKGAKAPEAAAAIHTDFDKKLEKVECWRYEDVMKYGGLAECRKRGRVSTKGRDYVVQTADILEFKTKR